MKSGCKKILENTVRKKKGLFKYGVEFSVLIERHNEVERQLREYIDEEKKVPSERKSGRDLRQWREELEDELWKDCRISPFDFYDCFLARELVLFQRQFLQELLDDPSAAPIEDVRTPPAFPAIVSNRPEGQSTGSEGQPCLSQA